MLVLTRKIGQAIEIGRDIVVVIVDTEPGRVKVGIQAPPDMKILRMELRNEESEQCQRTSY